MGPLPLNGVTERFGQRPFGIGMRRPTMYAERGPGSFSTGSASPGVAHGSEIRTDQEQIERPVSRPQLPAPILDLTPAQAAPGRSRRLGRRLLVGAAILLALGSAGDFG